MTKHLGWGIIGTGTIAQSMSKALVEIGASIRGVASRSKDKATRFSEPFSQCQAYDDYRQMLKAPEIDIVYIASSNDLHRQHAMDAIKAQKAVLIEKPFAMNYEEGKQIADLAKERKVFCMEALWTRFIPAIVEAKKIIESGQLGQIYGFEASFGHRSKAPNSAAIFDPQRGGGALLDLGVYLLSLGVYFFKSPTSATGTLAFGPTCVEEETTVSCLFHDTIIGAFQNSLRCNLRGHGLIRAENADLEIPAPIYAPTRLTLHTHSTEPNFVPPTWSQRIPPIKRAFDIYRHKLHPSIVTKSKSVRYAMEGSAYTYQLRAVENAIQRGWTEEPQMPLSESLEVLRIIDNLKANNSSAQ